MATLSSILAWRIPWTEEPSRLQSMRLQELDTTERLSTPSIVQLSKVWARTNSCSWSQILSAQLSWPVTNDNNEGRSPSGLLQNGNNRNWTWQSLPWSLWLQILPASQRRQWQPTPVLLPRKSHGQRSLVGYTVHGVAKSRTWLGDFIFTFHFHALEKEMATHSSVLAWRIPGTGAWWAAVCGVAQSRTRLTWLSSISNSIACFKFFCLPIKWFPENTCLTQY